MQSCRFSRRRLGHPRSFLPLPCRLSPPRPVLSHRPLASHRTIDPLALDHPATSLELAVRDRGSAIFREAESDLDRTRCGVSYRDVPTQSSATIAASI
jgi:hypothetical protein